MRNRISIITFLAAVLFPRAVFELFAYRPDPDSYWHLAAGKWMITHWQVPYFDPFGGSNPRVWLNHEWLSEGIFAFVNLAGFQFVMVVQIAAAVLIFGCQYRLLRFKKLSQSGALLAAMITFIPLTPFIKTRPQIFTYLLILVLVSTLERWQNRKVQWFVVILTMVAWVNLHGGGTAFAFVVLGGYIISAFVAKEVVKGKQLSILTLFALASILLNPYGWHMLTYPYQVMLNTDMSKYIGEWQSPDFHAEKAALILILEIAGLLVWKKKHLGFKDGAFLLGLLAMCLMSGRHLALLYLLSPIYLSDVLNSLFSYFESIMIKTQWILKTLAAILLILGIALMGYQMRSWPKEIPAGIFYPKGAYDYLDSHLVKGKIYTPYDWGGSLVYRFEGRIQPSIDGRADLYSGIYNKDDHLHEEMELLYSRQRDPIRYFAKYPFKVVLVDKSSWLYYWFLENKDYQEVYQDEQAVIFTKAKK